MQLNKLYDIAEKENIKIHNYYIENCNGFFLQYKNINSIALNYKEICSSSKEKSILAEELGHYYCDATYSPLCKDKQLISKQEYRAKKWAFKLLINPQMLNDMFTNKSMTKYEMMEELEVSEEIFEMACNYYKNNGLLSA